MPLKIDVLGTKYTLKRVNRGQDAYMDKMGFAGYCDNNKKYIAILNLKSLPDWADEPEQSIVRQEKETIRHELIHAFLNESGLSWSSLGIENAWAKNEEMVDWFAIQMPKLLKAFKEADCI